MLSDIVYATALPVEMSGLFAVWNWSVRGRSLHWLLIGAGLLIALVSTLVLTTPKLPGRMYLGFAGMYVFSGLAWAWWADGLHPTDWRLGEIWGAILAVALFILANSSGYPVAH